MNTKTKQLEALLFVMGEALSYKELCEHLVCDQNELQTYIEELQSALTTHGLMLITTETHVQLTTASEVSTFLTNILHVDAEDLSPAAAETLTLVAYRGPVTRSEIDAIRGVDSRRMIRQLVARDLIRKDATEQIPTYTITENFLTTVGITNVTELPQYEVLSSHEKIEQLLNQQEREQ